MSVQIKVQIDAKAIESFLTKANIRHVSAAVARALDRTMVTVQKEAAQGIQKEIKLPIRDIKAALKVQKMYGPSKPLNAQEAQLLSSTASISLSRFKPRQVASGVRVNITGSPQVISHAFLATIGGNARGNVFRRVRVEKPGTPIRRVGPNRSELPIRKQATQGINKKLAEIAPSLQKTALEVFYPRFNHEFARRARL